MKKILLSTLAASTLIVAAHAEEKTTPLTTHTELGYIETSGNTSTRTLNLDAKAKKAWGKHHAALHLDAQYATSSSKETKNKYLIEANYDYALTDNLYFDYLAGYKVDKFSTFDYQFYTGPGIKYKALSSKKQNLSLEANILYAIDQYTDTRYADLGKTVIVNYPNTNNLPVLAITKGRKKDYAAFKLKANYDYQITQNLKFAQELAVRGEAKFLKNYFGYSKTSLISKLSDIFSAGVSYKVDYVNQPAAGKYHTDTTFTLNLIADY
jgi:putative salt-induced outer membrane protein